MKYRLATLDDIDKVLELHYKYQVDFIKEEDKVDGFVTTAYTAEQLTSLIDEEQGLFIAIKEEKIVAYVMSASWHFWSIWPMFEHMVKDLHNLTYLGKTLSVENSYQYGPVCIDKSVRGSGILEKIFDFTRQEMSKNFLF
ncbi:GNAT family acetyltransferase [Sulfurimonas sp. CS5]|uniref:GNAT family acetyltransferase n=1 Tax=Sulfurimonas sp. CS5 TaxID=3391145 RepID=UPI0039EB8847